MYPRLVGNPTFGQIEVVSARKELGKCGPITAGKRVVKSSRKTMETINTM